MEHSNERIALHFTAEKLVEVAELTRALASVARTYERVVRGLGIDGLEDEDYRLYVTKIEKNCIFAELAGYTASTLPVIGGAISHHNSLAQFSHYVDRYISWFSGQRREAGVSPGKTETQDIANMLALASSPDGKGELRVEQIKYEDGKRTSVTKVDYSPSVVAEALEGARNHLAALDAEDREIRRNVLLEIKVLDIKRSKSDKKSFDRGTILEISTREIRVTWESEMDGMRVKSPEATLGNMEYIVDVQIVRNSNGLPRLYRVLSVIDVVESGEDTEGSKGNMLNVVDPFDEEML